MKKIDRAKVKVLVEMGYTMDKIAKTMKCHRMSIPHILRELKIKTAHMKVVENRPTTKQIMSDRELGMTIPEISKKRNMSISGVWSRLHRSGQYVYIDSQHGKEWKKMARNTKYLGRIVSLPAVYIEECGLDPKKELIGKWTVGKGELILKLKEVKP